jgi:2,3,4,5-tetrahydropyridine-2-carboxylate N-succinyltransferase
MVVNLKELIEQLWLNKDHKDVIDNYKNNDNFVSIVIDLLDSGEISVVERNDKDWTFNEWVKKGILLYFKVHHNQVINSGNCYNGLISNYFDKVPSKFLNWQEDDFIKSGIRAVPGCYVRKGSFIAKNVVLMPSFINIGAYVDEGTMIDTWATVGSCARVGKHCHIAGGAGIGGVLEPLQANPVIIEDHCFIGSRSSVTEGAIVRSYAVIANGVNISGSTKIVDRESGEIFIGEVPSGSVVVAGFLPNKQDQFKPGLSCAVIVKKIDEKTRGKVSINDLLRD